MLRFAIELPVLSNREVSDLFALCSKWLAGSPNYGVVASDIPLPAAGSIAEQEVDTVSIRVGLYRGSDAEVLGFRFEYVEEGKRSWTTEIIGNKSLGSFWIAVRVYCDSLIEEAQLPKPRKPYILKQLFKELGTDLDGNVKVSDRPIRLAEHEISLAGQLLRGLATSRLPVVYVSRGFKEISAQAIKRLAICLAGQAHVVVEPSRAFSIRLRQDVDGQNVFNGAIGLYWPRGTSRYERFFPQDFSNENVLIRKIQERIESVHVNRRPTDFLTWVHLQELLSRQRLAELRRIESPTIDDYVAAFDSEVSALKEKLETERREVERLREELACDRPGEGLLTSSDIEEFYEGEVGSILVEVVEQQLKNLDPGSRRYEVVSSVLKANESQRSVSRMRDRVKACFMDRIDHQTLRTLGFDVVSDNKHRKIRYRDDAKYTFTLPNTPSDHRSLKNMASDINRKLF